MSDAEKFAGLEEFLAARGSALLATAVLLAGSKDVGEDLLQLALERLLRRWRRIDGDPEPYLRRTLYHLAVDRWRWRGRHPEVLLTNEMTFTGPDPAADIDLRDALARALASLPARQRAVLVLRYFEQLSEAEIAKLLGCSAGAVKSSASRGLQRMRATVRTWERGVSGAAMDGMSAGRGGPARDGLAPSAVPGSIARNGAQA